MIFNVWHSSRVVEYRIQRLFRWYIDPSSLEPGGRIGSPQEQFVAVDPPAGHQEPFRDPNIESLRWNVIFFKHSKLTKISLEGKSRAH
ncbi:hypothetical protein BDP27DRAFT_672358 [Rhodocollybia butyracea]|uniref:Uncharacterized protein n=1 Tax=Rhodocollybia butyracea TaxID=206335 RepID=A0A9P5PPI8_9AGAR|nr:hypothetical protein BDP27DRAFT_672358 [Rhodocollybia butyracea]